MSPADACAGTRCFLALLPDESSRARLAAFRSDHRHPYGLRWLDPASLHLTLRFFGNASLAQIARLKDTLPSLARPLPALAARRCAVWPNRARPRVLVLVLAAPRALLDLARAGEEMARACGFDPEPRAFKAHLTLARLRPGCAPPPAPVLPPAVAFDALSLQASDLHAAGARYRSLVRVAVPPAP